MPKIKSAKKPRATPYAVDGTSTGVGFVHAALLDDSEDDIVMEDGVLGNTQDLGVKEETDQPEKEAKSRGELRKRHRMQYTALRKKLEELDRKKKKLSKRNVDQKSDRVIMRRLIKKMKDDLLNKQKEEFEAFEKANGGKKEETFSFDFSYKSNKE